MIKKSSTMGSFPEKASIERRLLAETWPSINADILGLLSSNLFPNATRDPDLAPALADFDVFFCNYTAFVWSPDLGTKLRTFVNHSYPTFMRTFCPQFPAVLAELKESLQKKLSNCPSPPSHLTNFLSTLVNCQELANQPIDKWLMCLLDLEESLGRALGSVNNPRIDPRFAVKRFDILATLMAIGDVLQLVDKWIGVRFRLERLYAECYGRIWRDIHYAEAEELARIESSSQV
jgi:hypothetical protein